MEQFASFLKGKGVNPSTQRLKIYAYLYSNHNHPTVDNIYTALAPEMPKLSKTTVYNTIKLFLDKGIALVVDTENNEARYDADTSSHAHFKCLSCGGLFDVSINSSDLNFNNIDGFQIQHTQIQIKGYCKICASY